LRSSLCAYKETQDELTGELADFKEKYREVVDLLRDTQEELKSQHRRGSSAKGYLGQGLHGVRGLFHQDEQDLLG